MNESAISEIKSRVTSGTSPCSCLPVVGLQFVPRVLLPPLKIRCHLSRILLLRVQSVQDAIRDSQLLGGASSTRWEHGNLDRLVRKFIILICAKAPHHEGIGLVCGKFYRSNLFNPMMEWSPLVMPQMAKILTTTILEKSRDFSAVRFQRLRVVLVFWSSSLKLATRIPGGEARALNMVIKRRAVQECRIWPKSGSSGVRKHVRSNVTWEPCANYRRGKKRWEEGPSSRLWLARGQRRSSLGRVELAEVGL